MAGIYIHIPYCKKLCYYCDFYHVLPKGDSSAFFDALIKEASLKRDYTGDEVITTIYFGGGTPSVCRITDLASLLHHINRLYRVDADCETTIELNPDDVTPEYLNGLRDIGINRVSLGIQSWRDKDLKMLNRRHDAAGAANALNETIKAGFGNVTIDLIYGLPGMTTSDWISNLDITFSYNIQHLSAYHLTFEQGTVFGKMLEKNLITEIEEEESSTQFNTLIEKAESAGFIHYEISNFGKDGFFSRHNSNYWKQIPYIGLGPSAHSFNRYSRQWNVKDINKYITAVNDGTVFFEREELDKRRCFNEYMMTSLRTMWGADLDYIDREFEKEGFDYVINIALRFKEYGLMKQEKNTLVLTKQGKMISDNIISEFMMPVED